MAPRTRSLPKKRSPSPQGDEGLPPEGEVGSPSKTKKSKAEARRKSLSRAKDWAVDRKRKKDATVPVIDEDELKENGYGDRVDKDHVDSKKAKAAPSEEVEEAEQPPPPEIPPPAARRSTRRSRRAGASGAGDGAESKGQSRAEGEEGAPAEAPTTSPARESTRRGRRGKAKAAVAALADDRGVGEDDVASVARTATSRTDDRSVGSRRSTRRRTMNATAPREATVPSRRSRRKAVATPAEEEVPEIKSEDSAEEAGVRRKAPRVIAEEHVAEPAAAASESERRRRRKAAVVATQEVPETEVRVKDSLEGKVAEEGLVEGVAAKEGPDKGVAVKEGLAEGKVAEEDLVEGVAMKESSEEELAEKEGPEEEEGVAVEEGSEEAAAVEEGLEEMVGVAVEEELEKGLEESGKGKIEEAELNSVEDGEFKTSMALDEDINEEEKDEREKMEVSGQHESATREEIVEVEHEVASTQSTEEHTKRKDSKDETEGCPKEKKSPESHSGNEISVMGSFFELFPVFFHCLVIQWTLAFAFAMTYGLDWWLSHLAPPDFEGVTLSQRASCTTLGLWLLVTVVYSIAFGARSKVGWILRGLSLVQAIFSTQLAAENDSVPIPSLAVYSYSDFDFRVLDVLAILCLAGFVSALMRPNTHSTARSENAITNQAAVTRHWGEASSPLSFIGQRVATGSVNEMCLGTIENYNSETGTWLVRLDGPSPKEEELNQVQLAKGFKLHFEHFSDILEAM